MQPVVPASGRDAAALFSFDLIKFRDIPQISSYYGLTRLTNSTAVINRNVPELYSSVIFV